jgi:hypothetical protein
MRVAFGLAGTQRQHQGTPIERLDLRFFVDAQDQRAFRWLQVQAHDVANLDDTQESMPLVECQYPGVSVPPGSSESLRNAGGEEATDKTRRGASGTMSLQHLAPVRTHSIERGTRAQRR